MLSIINRVSTYKFLKKMPKNNKVINSYLYLINNKNMLSPIMLLYKGLYLINKLKITYVLLMPFLLTLLTPIIMPLALLFFRASK